MSDHPSDHLAIYAAESAALEPTSWERWIDRVERFMGHDADGNLATDGYSMDTFVDMFDAGLTPQQASLRIIGALFVTSDGATYRLARAEGSRSFLDSTKQYTEKFDVLTTSGSQTARYDLPVGATLVFAPDRGVTAAGICSRCGRLVGPETVLGDEWQASAHCQTCLNGPVPGK